MMHYQLFASGKPVTVYQWPCRAYDIKTYNGEIYKHIADQMAFAILTGEGAVILIVAGLGADGDVAVLEQTDSGLDVGGGHTQHHIAPLALGHDGLDLLSKSLGLRQGIVHLPVAGNDSLAITTIHSYLSNLFLKCFI